MTSEVFAFPLSSAQLSLWFLDKLYPGSPLYNMATAVRLRGPLDVTVLEQSLQEIVRRHEALRTTFATIDGSPLQVVASSLALTLPLVDLRALPVSERETEARRLASEEAQRPFDLTEGPLLRLQLLRLGEEEYLLLLTIHHIVFDGWSIGVLFEELGSLYRAYAAGEPSPLPELPIQYADFAVWQRQLLQGELLANELAYWARQLQGMPALLELPTDRPRPPVQGVRGAQQSLAVSPALTRALKELSRREGVTLFMTLLAAFQTLLHRYTGQVDLAVGSPTAGRTRSETEELIGLFVNVLVLRTDLSGDPSFRKLLSRVEKATVEAYAHSNLPFEKLVEALQPERHRSHTPLFQVMFALQNAPVLPLELLEVAASTVEVHTGTAKFDLTLMVAEAPEGLQARIEYNTDLFDAPTITRLLGHLHTLLAAIAADPDQRLSTLPLLTAAERQQLLGAWNDTAAAYPRDRCIHELFEAQVERTPEAVAVQGEGQSLTYGELNRRANRLAHQLRDLGVGPEVVVGICVERSLAMVVGLLGILKAGGAYLPLDPSWPKERLGFLIREAQVPVLLTQERLTASLPEHGARLVCLDIDGESRAREDETNPVSGATAANLAYVLFTSGSTGQPQGVCVPHRAVVRLVKGADYARLTSADLFLQFAPLSFDASTFEIWGCLLNGARLVAFPPHLPSLAELGSFIERHQISTLWLTAGLFHQIAEDQRDTLRNVRQLLVGGDVLSVPHVRTALQGLKGCQLINGYGPTESTTFACCYPIPSSWPADRSIPIGRPIANTRVYLLDRHLQPVPIGVPGELYIGGAGLARGYLNHPALTAERFIPNPFSDEPGARLYRTGDLARYLPDGNLEFLGRNDNQVKLRGFRIELGEIEAALTQHPAVREAVVLDREDRPGNKRLIAYVVVDSKQALTSSELSSFLRKKLPDYMMPAVFLLRDALPLTSQGKVDRRALPAPGPARPNPASEHAAPRDPLEIQLAKIWEQTLDVRPIGITDNFFHLGGHSLLAARMFAQIQKAWGKSLPLATLFQAPTVEQLAALLREGGWSPAWASLVVIQPNGFKPPLFCVHGMGGNVLCYHDLARHLGLHQPFYALQSLGLDGKQTGKIPVEKLAACYLKEVRSVQPDGPYYLGGLSFGGLVAFEMAQQLHAQGETVALLALFDTGGPGYPKWRPPLQRLGCHLQNLKRLGPKQRLIYTWVRVRAAAELLERKIWRAALRGHRGFGHSLPRPLRNVAMVNLQAAREYVPKIYPGRVTLFRSMEQPVGCYEDPHSGWSELAGGGLEIHEVPGDHITLIEEPHVQILAEQLKACLQSTQSERESASVAL